MDWQLAATRDGGPALVSVGSIQSTFSASAWHFSLLADQLKHINDQGQCVRGGGSLFKLHSDAKEGARVVEVRRAAQVRPPRAALIADRVHVARRVTRRVETGTGRSSMKI